MATLNPRMMLTLSEIPEAAWVSTLYQGFSQGRWSEDDIESFERLDTKARKRAVKGHGAKPPTPSPEIARTRRTNRSRDKRLKDRRLIPGLRYVRRCSLDPFLDARLSKGARNTLIYLIARCGKARTFSAPTCWVAQDLAVTTRTIQSHYAALETAGYILRSSPDRRGRTAVRICAAAEPPPFQKNDPRKSGFDAVESTKISSPTYVTRTKDSEGTGEPYPAPQNLDLESRETGAEPPRPARPPSPASEGAGAGAAAPSRLSGQPSVTADPPQAAEGQQADPTPLDLAMAEIMARVLDHARTRPDETESKERPPEAHDASRGPGMAEPRGDRQESPTIARGGCPPRSAPPAGGRGTPGAREGVGHVR